MEAAEQCVRGAGLGEMVLDVLPNNGWFCTI
jgi:hypothetical protein